ncbi:unnamed protein product [Pocillopora meandrina]|uniref:Uncharacterized protein n=1 Tax=Pocillopora meandrina TaxID=46732 RepID=A0AAU9XTA8_9CNID|nr:unnamed protein product [Pocillopora meandrina]
MKFEDRGMYTCTAENLLGRVELSVNITVRVPAKFISEPKRSVTAYKTWDMTLKCDIFGFPSPVITWTRSRDQLPINRNVIDGNQLTIKNTKKEDGGAYVCRGANPMRNVMAVLWIVVKDVVNPYIVSSPPSEIQVQNVGDKVRLKCSAGGSPLPRVTWFKDGRKVDSTAERDGNNLIKTEFVIDRFQPDDAGLYKCSFYNEKNATTEATVKLILVNCGDPGSVSNGHKRGSRYWTGESVSFTCDPQYHLVGPNKRTCLPSGNWSEIQPECRRICPPLKNPKYGLIYGGEFWEGKQVSFTCRSGFGLIGPLERRCLMNGSWTGSQPECNAVSALWKASTIIAGNLYYYSNLHQFLKPAAGSHPQWLLCYRASTHGWSVSTFHNRCDGKPNTVTIVKAGQYVLEDTLTFHGSQVVGTPALQMLSYFLFAMKKD